MRKMLLIKEISRITLKISFKNKTLPKVDKNCNFNFL
jgi:hypothetical protein